MSDKFRYPLFQDGVMGEFNNRLSDMEKHDRGNKVQFVFTNSGSGGYVSNAEWVLTGYMMIGGGAVSSGTSVSVFVPSDTVVNSATIYIYAAPFYYSNATIPVTEYRQAKSMYLSKSDTFNIEGVYSFSSGLSQQIYPSSSSIHNDVFGSSTWSPDVTLVDGTRVKEISGDILPYITSGSQSVFNIKTDDTTSDYFSLVKVFVVINGYTVNR